MDVAVSELRANLSTWLDRARTGDEVVVTERGVPVARLVGVEGADVLERLEREGLISRPTAAQRPTAAGRRRIAASSSVSDLVIEQRR